MPRKKADSLNIDVFSLRLQKFFEEDATFTIKNYQRDYSWTKKEWKALWEDITNEPNEHFIGSIVTVGGEKLPTTSVVHEVVDGQQRLTTLMLLYCALRDSLAENKKPQAAKKIEDSILMAKSGALRLTSGTRDSTELQNILASGTKVFSKAERKHKIYAGYLYFQERISEYSHKPADWISLSNKLQKVVVLVWVMSKRREDAFRLFETLNDRGLPLTSADLIKVAILTKASSRPYRDHEKDIIIKWDKMMDKLKRHKIRFFRQYHLAMHLGRGVSDRNVHKSYKSILKDETDPQSSPLVLCDDLFAASELYRRIVEVDHPDDFIKLKLEDLADLGAVTSYPLVLKLFILGMKKEDLLRVLDSILVMTFRRMICQKPVNEVDLLYNQWANGKFDPESQTILPVTAKRLVAVMEKNTPGKTEFLREIKTYQFKSNRQVTYIFRELLQKSIGRRSMPEVTIPNSPDVHVEHIMPQTLDVKLKPTAETDWIADLEKWSKLDRQKVIDRHKETVNLLGNLALLSGQENQSIGNRRIQHKVGVYKESALYETTKLEQLKRWDFNNIATRTTRLAHVAETRWSFNLIKKE